MMDVIRYRTDEGCYHGLHVKTGRVWVQLLLINGKGLRLTKIPKRDLRHVTVLTTPKLAAAKRDMKHAAQRFGCNKTVARILGIRHLRSVK